MQILLTGDLHFHKAQFGWIEAHKEEFDCICLSGDLIHAGTGDFNQQTEWVSDWLIRLDKQLFICSGNHDLDECGEASWLEKTKCAQICIDNQIKVLNGIKFGCVPYIGADLSRFHDCDILVTHVPPKTTTTSKSRVEGRIKDWGDEDLYHALIEEVITPKYILCGHVENPLNNKDHLFDTVIINPGAQHDIPVPRHEVIRIQ